MKLYTEEQVKKALDFFITDEFNKGKIIETLTPIQLPSNKEINKQSYSNNFDSLGVMIYQMGACWVLEQIKNEVIL